jgi:hypothetical protein
MGTFVVTLLLGVLLIEGTSLLAPVFNVDLMIPSAAVVAVAWAASRRDPATAVICAFLFGMLTAMHSSGARGLTLLSLLAVWGVTYASRRSFPLMSAWGFAAWCAVCCLVADVVVVATALLFMPSVRLWPGLLLHTPAVALLTGVQGLMIHLLSAPLEPLLQERQERSSLSFPVSGS